MVLRVPSGVVNNTHNANTFAPYDPNAALGDVSPTSPVPQEAESGGKSGKCGVFGKILLVAIAVAVTIVTKNAALGAKIFKAGTTAAAITTGAIAGAAGSIASQAVGVATGIQDKFSFKQVGLAAIGGGVGGGIADKFGTASTVGGAVVRGAAQSALTQGIAVVTGLQSKFSFAGVAAAGVGAGVGFEFAEKFGDKISDVFGGGTAGSIASSIAQGAASAIANAATRSAIEGSNFGDNVVAAIPDVIGNAIGTEAGNSLAAAMARRANEAGTSNDEAKVVKTAENGQNVGGAVARTLAGGHSGRTVATGGYVNGDEVVSTGARNVGGDHNQFITQVLSARHNTTSARQSERAFATAEQSYYLNESRFAAENQRLLAAQDYTQGVFDRAYLHDIAGAINQTSINISEPYLIKLEVEQRNVQIDAYNREVEIANVRGLRANRNAAQSGLVRGLSIFYGGGIGVGAAAIFAGEDIASGNFTATDVVGLVLLRGKGRGTDEAINVSKFGKNRIYNSFGNKFKWTARNPKGTGQTYNVTPRKDIEWDFVRTTGDKRFIGKTNAEAAAKGLPPQLPDGKFATLHHIGQKSTGPLVEASTKYHGVGKPGQHILHQQFGKNKPHPTLPIDRVKFRVDKSEYWKWRVNN